MDRKLAVYAVHTDRLKLIEDAHFFKSLQRAAKGILINKNGNLKVFVLSEVGKPIFVSCGYEEQLCSLIALMQTFVMVVASWNDNLIRIRSSRLQIAFSYRSPLILCIVSRSGFQLDTQVDLVYKQVSNFCSC